MRGCSRSPGEWPGLGKQGLRMPACRVTIGIAQHSRKLGDAVFAVQPGDIAGRHPAPRLLAHCEVTVGARSDLGQMSDDKNLTPLTQLSECGAHLRANLATDALIHFVEH